MKKVKCIYNMDGGNNLTIGHDYSVIIEEDGWYHIINDLGNRSCYCAEGFVPVDEPALSCTVTDGAWHGSGATAGDKPVSASNKYSREIKPGIFVDVYDILRAFNVADPCLQHMLKKCLAAGARGHKSTKEDLQDILASAKRAVEMHEEWNKQE